MIDACRTVGERYEATCIIGTAHGVAVGLAGIEHRYRPFCQLVDDKFRSQCLASARRPL